MSFNLEDFVDRLFRERGGGVLEEARKIVLQDKLESKEVYEALTYFMTEYWHDTARPAILSLVCEGVGGDPRVTTPIAIPMTLISGALDIHDDIIDQSREKRSRLTVLGKFGRDVALLTADALLFKGFTLLYKAIEKGIPIDKLSTIVQVIEKMFFELGDAEALELNLRRRVDTAPESYLHVLRKKAADVEAHTRIGAILGGGSEADVEALGNYGRALGMLIILRDEWIDTVYLKEARHRVEREAPPIPILYAMQKPEARHTILSIISKKKLSVKDVETLREITEEADGFKHLETLMKRLAAEAYTYIKDVKQNREYLELIVKAVLLPKNKIS